MSCNLKMVLRLMFNFRIGVGLYFNGVHYTCRFLLCMVALCNRADHYIFALWFLPFFFLFFPRLISAVRDWMSAILLHVVWP